MQKWSRVFRTWELFKRLSGLSPVAIELYGYVAEHCDWRNGRYVATSAEVANALSVTVRSVQRANNELEAAELIRFKRGIYAVNPGFNWGEKLEYFKVLLLLNGEKIAQVIDFAEATQAMSKLATKGVGRATLREVFRPNTQGKLNMLNTNPKEKQVTALNMLRANWKRHRTMLLSASIGFGKTAIAVFITDGMVSRGMRIMFLAPYTVLLEQTATRFVEYGLPSEEISYVWRNHPLYDPEKLIQIASADTLIRRQFPDNIDLLIVDEADLRRKKLLEIIRDTDIHVVGLSGTPFAPWLRKYYEKLIKPTTMKELISLGDLSTYEFYTPDRPDISNVKTSNLAVYGRDYNEDQLAEIMGDSTLVGNIIKNWLEHGEDRATVCFCVNVKHANYVTMEFNRAGVNAEVMTADTPHDERQYIINRFEQGVTKIIVNVGVLVVGFDSDVRCIIYARPTKSEIRWVQCLAGAENCARKRQVPDI